MIRFMAAIDDVTPGAEVRLRVTAIHDRLAPDVQKALADRPGALQLVEDAQIAPGVRVEERRTTREPTRPHAGRHDKAAPQGAAFFYLFNWI